MKSATITKKPRMSGGFPWPSWWHHHGIKAVLKESGPRKAVIGSNAATLTISRVEKEGSPAVFHLVWSVVHAFDMWSMGQVVMDERELKAAFGLSNETGDYGDWLIEAYGAESAEQRLYIRWKRYLNIPGPGTAHDGDPNMSIEIEGQIQNAIRTLLQE
ncbi:MAG TPA: hypothetical protein VFT82_02150 [Candidatus Paceibacterota bacterium]|nr:hypothetical protein [Candidatus Paceibacterota bacterium]